MTADLKQGSNLAGKILASGQLPSVLLTVTGAPTGGTFTSAIGGVNAAATAYNATAGTLQTNLQAVAAAGVTVAVSGSAGGPYTVTVTTTAGNRNQAISISALALTGGTSPGVSIAGVDATIYTVPGASAVKVGTAVLTNFSTIPVVVTVSVVPSGGSQDGTHIVLGSYLLGAGDTTKLNEIEGAFLDAGATVVVNANANSAVNYLLTGAVSS